MKFSTLMDKYIRTQHKLAVIDNVIKHLDKFVGSDVEDPPPLLDDGCIRPIIAPEAVEEVLGDLHNYRRDLESKLKGFSEYSTVSKSEKI
jgi:hypothetical protein